MTTYGLSEFLEIENHAKQANIILGPKATATATATAIAMVKAKTKAKNLRLLSKKQQELCFQTEVLVILLLREALHRNSINTILSHTPEIQYLSIWGLSCVQAILQRPCVCNMYVFLLYRSNHLTHFSQCCNEGLGTAFCLSDMKCYWFFESAVSKVSLIVSMIANL